MKTKQTVWFRKWYYISALALLLLLFVMYIGRGWIRFHVEPGLVKTFPGNNLQETSEKQYKALSQPFTELGLGTPDSQNQCVTMYASRFHTKIFCSSVYKAYSDKVASLSPDLGVRAARLDALLKANGWQGGNTTLTTLGQNIAKGIDWTPDAAYAKQFGKIFCLADFNTAFSKPKPPAMSGNISCSRDYEI